MKIKFSFGVLLGTIFILSGCSNQSQVTNDSILEKSSSSEELSEHNNSRTPKENNVQARHDFELREITSEEEYNFPEVRNIR